MENIVIVPVTSKDLLQLQSIGKETFSQTFCGTNTEENMSKYLAEGFSTQQLEIEMNN